MTPCRGPHFADPQRRSLRRTIKGDVGVVPSPEPKGKTPHLPSTAPNFLSPPAFPPSGAMMAARLRVALLLSVCLCAARARPSLEPTIRLPSERAAAGAAEEGTDDAVGTRWAVLIAGSNGYYNYRHQVRRAPLLRSDRRLGCLIPSRQFA